MSSALDEAVRAEVALHTSAGENKKVTKVLCIGNSGRGKSFLSNLILDEAKFSHKTIAASVTSSCEFGSYYSEDVGTIVVFNVPGLIEAKEEHWVRNQAAIELALQVIPEAATVVILVSRVVGGRLQDEDTVAFKVVLDYLPTLPADATGLIFNAVDPDDFKTEAHQVQWEQDVAEGSCALLAPRVRKEHCRCIPKIKKKERDAFTGDAVATNRDTLRTLLGELQRFACPVQPRPGSNLKLDRQVLKEGIASLRSAGETDEKAHALALEKIQNEGQQALEDKKKQNAKAEEWGQRVIQQANSQPPPGRIPQATMMNRVSGRNGNNCCVEKPIPTNPSEAMNTAAGGPEGEEEERRMLSHTGTVNPTTTQTHAPVAGGGGPPPPQFTVAAPVDFSAMDAQVAGIPAENISKLLIFQLFFHLLLLCED